MPGAPEAAAFDRAFENGWVAGVCVRIMALLIEVFLNGADGKGSIGQHVVREDTDSSTNESAVEALNADSLATIGVDEALIMTVAMKARGLLIVIEWTLGRRAGATGLANLHPPIIGKFAPMPISTALALPQSNELSHRSRSHGAISYGTGLDGTCMLFCGREYRQAMVGTIAFYDASGERLHTNYIAAAPEHGKATFLQRMDEEIERIKKKYGGVRYIGISDGAADYLPWLKQHTSTQVLDFWHTTEYLAETAGAIHRSKTKQKEWLDETCHALKHNHRAAESILGELEEAFDKQNLSAGVREKLEAALSYFGNNLGRMNYASYRKTNLPIGSGITEAACKTVVKSRMCGSGMKWTQSGSDGVLTLRALSLTTNRWKAFWENLAKNGLTTN